ncbi:MAG TPA: polysaccharide deacetylase family protein [Micromonosporaceae bacterium]
MVHRDYVGYGGTPPPIRWPGGAAVAVSLVLNIEDGAERATARGDHTDDLGAHWVRHQVVAGQRNLTLESAFDYGSRAGIWRLLRALREYQVPATAFCCAEALASNPAVADALLADCIEIANHGLRWDTHTDLDRPAQLAKIRASTALIEQRTGQRPCCWYSRDGIAPWTYEDLLAEGYQYDSNSFCDDLPYLMQVDDTDLVVVPYAGDTNDSGLLRLFRTPRAFAAYLCDSLTTLCEDRSPAPWVLSVGLHPRLIGRPAAIMALRRFLTFATQRPVWFATRAEIARYWRERVAVAA